MKGRLGCEMHVDRSRMDSLEFSYLLSTTDISAADHPRMRNHQNQRSSMTNSRLCNNSIRHRSGLAEANMWTNRDRS
jgi:hypothetical protein